MNITIQKHSLRLDTAKYTLEDVKKEIEEDFQILISLGYTDLALKKVKVEWGKALKQYGSCQGLILTLMSSKLTKTLLGLVIIRKSTIQLCMNVFIVLMAVLIMVLIGKKAAAKVNARFDFTPIERCGTDDNYNEFLKSQAKYQITCKACHHTWNYYRKTRIFCFLCKW